MAQHHSFAQVPDAGAAHDMLDPGYTWTSCSLGWTGCDEEVNGRLDFVLLNRDPMMMTLQPSCRMAVQHVSVAHNIGDFPNQLLDNGITSATSPGNFFYGTNSPLSDHYGLNIELACYTPNPNPSLAWVINPDEQCDNQQCTNGQCTVSKQACAEASDCDCLQSTFHTVEEAGHGKVV